MVLLRGSYVSLGGPLVWVICLFGWSSCVGLMSLLVVLLCGSYGSLGGPLVCHTCDTRRLIVLPSARCYQIFKFCECISLFIDLS